MSARDPWEPYPTPAHVLPLLVPGARVRWRSGHWRRKGADDWHPYDGEGQVVTAPRLGSVVVEYVSQHGERPKMRAVYTTDWTCFEPLGD